MIPTMIAMLQTIAMAGGSGLFALVLGVCAMLAYTIAPPNAEAGEAARPQASGSSAPQRMPVNQLNAIGVDPSINGYSVNGVLNLRAYGAFGDLVIDTDGDCSVSNIDGPARLACAKPRFSAGDKGKEIFVPKAGDSPGGRTLDTTIAEVIDSTQVILGATARHAANSVNVAWGHDDTAAINRWCAAGASGGNRLYAPIGRYLNHGVNCGSGDEDIFGAGSTATAFYAINVTNPGRTREKATSVGFDLSAALGSRFSGIKWVTGFRGAPDTAAKVNIFAARTSNSGQGVAIEHVFENDLFETWGNDTYDVVLYGYEQTDFINCHYSSEGTSSPGLLYLSSMNTPGFVDPYYRILDHGPVGVSMTLVGLEGTRTTFNESAGKLIVLDEGVGTSCYEIGVHKAYAGVGDRGSIFLSDTGHSSTSIKHVTLEHINIEDTAGGNCPTCQVVSLGAAAKDWTLNDIVAYQAGREGFRQPVYAFNGGFLGGTATALDANGGGARNVQFHAPSCLGSVLSLGIQNPSADCTDYLAMAGAGAGQEPETAYHSRLLSPSDPATFEGAANMLDIYPPKPFAIDLFKLTWYGYSCATAPTIVLKNLSSGKTIGSFQLDNPRGGIKMVPLSDRFGAAGNRVAEYVAGGACGIKGSTGPIVNLDLEMHTNAFP